MDAELSLTCWKYVFIAQYTHKCLRGIIQYGCGNAVGGQIPFAWFCCNFSPKKVNFRSTLIHVAYLRSAQKNCPDPEENLFLLKTEGIHNAFLIVSKYFSCYSPVVERYFWWLQKCSLQSNRSLGFPCRSSSLLPHFVQ